MSVLFNEEMKAHKLKSKQKSGSKVYTKSTMCYTLQKTGKPVMVMPLIPSRSQKWAWIEFVNSSAQYILTRSSMLIQFKCIYIAPTQYNCYCLVSSVSHLISSDCASDNTACFPPASAFLVQHYTTHVVLNGVFGHTHFKWWLLCFLFVFFMHMGNARPRGRKERSNIWTGSTRTPKRKWPRASHQAPNRKQHH